MALKYVYEPQFYVSGWLDDAGATIPSWLDRDVLNDTIIPLDLVFPGFVDDEDTFFLLDGGPGTPIPVPDLPPGFTPTSGIWAWFEAGFFDDEDLFFVPAAVRALDAPDKLLRNEIIRVR